MSRVHAFLATTSLAVLPLAQAAEPGAAPRRFAAPDVAAAPAVGSASGIGQVMLALVVVLVLEVLLRWTRWGLHLRASGSNADVAASGGVRVRAAKFFSYVLAAGLVIPAGLIMMAQIGIGDGTPSVAYTLSSVTMVVLAGGSVFGGRGSFLGIIAAGLLAQQVLSAPQFLGLSQAWGYWLPGLVTVLAAVRRRPGPRWWLTTGATVAALLALTIVFDSLMIAADLFRYAEEDLLGVRLLLTPLEDLAWPLAAGLLLPSLWLLLTPQEER